MFGLIGSKWTRVGASGGASGHRCLIWPVVVFSTRLRVIVTASSISTPDDLEHPVVRTEPR
jgi:hypothetical protein